MSAHNWPQVHPYGDTKRAQWPEGLADINPLFAKARSLYPASPEMQREYVRAIEVVRGTSQGWVLDRKVERING